MEVIETLEEALKVLAGADFDRAAERNDIGFSGRDTIAGHSLVAEIGNWSPKQAALAAQIASNYRNTQLAGWELPTPKQAQLAAESAGAEEAEQLVTESQSSDRPFGLSLSPARKVSTARGPRYVRSAAVTQEFWTAWRTKKEQLKADGWSVGQHNGQWQVSLWTVAENSEGLPVKVEAKPLVPFKLTDEFLLQTLRPHQIPAVERAVSCLQAWPGYIDHSELGTGKTFNALATARVLCGTDLVTVICQKSVVTAWRQTAEKLGVNARVINYEQARKDASPVGKWCTEGKRKWFVWDVATKFLIFDEVHNCAATSTLNGKLLYAAGTQAIPTYAASGTYAESPLQMKNLGFVLGLHNGKNFWQWTQKYGCRRGKFGGFVFVSEWADSPGVKAQQARYMDALRTAVLEQNRGGRLKVSEILAKNPNAFPPTIITDQPIDMDDGGAIARAYDEVADELETLKARADRDGWVTKEDGTQVRRKVLELTIRLRARQKIEFLKVPTTVDLVEEAIAEGQNVVVFTNFDDTIDALVERLADHKPAVVRGGQDNRDEEVARFQTQATKLIVVNTKAGGTGVNLQGPRRRVFLFPGDSARATRQALGRVPRDGGEPSVQTILFAAGTIEEDVLKNCRRKFANIDALNDGDVGAQFARL